MLLDEPGLTHADDHFTLYKNLYHSSDVAVNRGATILAQCPSSSSEQSVNSTTKKAVIECSRRDSRDLRFEWKKRSSTTLAEQYEVEVNDDANSSAQM